MFALFSTGFVPHPASARHIVAAINKVSFARCFNLIQLLPTGLPMNRGRSLSPCKRCGGHLPQLPHRKDAPHTRMRTSLGRRVPSISLVAHVREAKSSIVEQSPPVGRGLRCGNCHYATNACLNGISNKRRAKRFIRSCLHR